MSASTLSRPAGSTTADGRSVWDRIWREATPAPKDDAVLERERNGERWAFAKQVLISQFGTLEGLRCVELGAGRGDFSALLAADGADVTLVDYSERAMEQAKSRFDRLRLQGRFVLRDVFELGLDKTDSGMTNAFDVSVSLGVIEHFRGRRRTEIVAAHARVLRPGGMTVISVPHAHCPPYRLWKMALEMRGWWPYGLEIPYSHRELSQRIERVGLSPVASHCCGLWRSVGDHVLGGLFRIRCGDLDRPSILDDWFGSMLTLYAMNGAAIKSSTTLKSSTTWAKGADE